MESSKVGIDNYCSITSSTCSLERALIEFDSIKVCRGIKSENVKASFGPQFVDFNGHWKHKNCFITVKNDKRLTIKIKKYRQNNDKKLKVHLTPSKREKFSNLMKSKKRINQKCSRVEKRLKVVQQNLDKIFSKSMAVGIRFYRNKEKELFKNSEETEDFTPMINNLFDALNRKYSVEGNPNGSKDFEVLNKAMEWLDSWEMNVNQGVIKDGEFLTHQTSEGLRVTIKSTIELSQYLLNECKFAYVLTAKMNQDNLEKFFGIIRQISGPNDHSSTPTFMQLYRMLTAYSLMKPPKSGNCSISEDQKPILELSDLKEMIDESLRSEIVKTLKKKMDTLVEDGEWDCEDIFIEHDYTKSSIFECVVYYLGG
ncbi:hypothetical protein ACI65C_006441 [Semiaphis heraclei]